MILIYLIIFLVTLIHYLRWFAIIQQKEYRFDRYLLFLKSREGFRDFFLPYPISFRKLPQKSDLKRPKFTPKIILIVLLTLIIILFSYYYISVFLNQIDLNTFILFLYLKAPATILIASVPATLITKIITYLEIKKAQQKIKIAKPIIIGITGSYGKSSTKFLIKHLLSSKLKVFCTPNSYNTIYSISHSINQSYKNEAIMVLEYGAYTQNEIKILAKYFQPQIAIITGITYQHLGLFKSLENIKKAKSELIKALPKNGTIFYNGLDKNVLKMVSSVNLNNIDFTKIPIINPILNQNFQLSFNYRNQKINTRIIGKLYLNNIKAAISIANFFKISEEKLFKALKSYKPNQIFISTKITKNGALIINDGKTSNPEGFLKAIELVKNSSKKKILLTNGIIDLGNQSNLIHTELAKQSHKVFTKVLYTEIIGKKEFLEIFGNNLISDKVQIIKELKKLNQNSILLIEGKIKTDILNIIN